MEKNVRILIVGPDPELPSEFEEARTGMRSLSLVSYFAGDYRQGLEMARSRQPELILVEVEREFSALRDFVSEVSAVAPEATVVAVYRPEMFGPDDSESDFIVEALRHGVRDFVPRPLSTADFADLLKRLFQRPVIRKGRLGRIVSFISNKGGVGKSTLATNTAVRLAQDHPDRVLLVDCSIQLGVCAYMLDLQPRTTILDAVRERDRIDETLLRQLTVPHPSGLRLLAAPGDALEASEVDEDALARILLYARRAFDYVIVDTFPMLDSLVIAILDLSDTTYVVFQGTVPSVAGIRRFLKVIREVGYAHQRVRVVLNQNYAEFPGNLRLADVEQQLGRKVDHNFRYLRKTLSALNAGQPLALKVGRKFGWGRSLEMLAREIEHGMPAVESTAPSEQKEESKSEAGSTETGEYPFGEEVPA